jgi:hypothetical protein
MTVKTSIMVIIGASLLIPFQSASANVLKRYHHGAYGSYDPTPASCTSFASDLYVACRRLNVTEHDCRGVYNFAYRDCMYGPR